MATEWAGRERFSGFADLYDAHRPAPPASLGHLLASYAGAPDPSVIDLGSGTGLSSRWAAGWARSVTGVEPNDEMRRVAESRPVPGVQYREGRAEDTGLAEGCGDVVLAVQAMHWMDPGRTLPEVARILRSGGVLAVIDADWPPVAGLSAAEGAWAVLHGRIRVFEARLARGETGPALRRPVDADDPALADDDLVDPHRNRLMPGGLRSWSKSGHLRRMRESREFSFTREVVFHEAVGGGAEEFKHLMHSQGSYQGLLRAGLTDGEIGATEFDRMVDQAFSRTRASPGLSFSWRARIGIKGLPEGKRRMAT